MSFQSASQNLLRTKLLRPRMPKNVVARARLLKQLDPPPPLTLVIAPAGYGKTTLLMNWLETCAYPNAWLSLDAGDSDLSGFLNYFVAAIRDLFPDFGGDILAMITSRSRPPVAVIARALINELDSLQQDFALVLDDFHLTSGPEIRALLIELLRFPPRPLHLVIAARHDPPLPLAHARLHGNLVEIRADDLRFSYAETDQLIEQALGRSVDAQLIRDLAEQTEGWVAGLHLTILYMRQHPGVSALRDAFTGSSRHIMEYLASEVLAQLPVHVRAFLMATSILDRLCGSLCDAVVGELAPGNDGQATLRWLEENGVFTTALDDQGEWFRVHPLLQQLLRRELPSRYSNDEVVEFQRRASQWCAAHGFLEEAIRHALAASDVETAVQVVANARTAVMNQEQWHRLERWVRLFPREVVEQQPELLMARAWILHVGYRVREVPPILDQVEALLTASVADPVAPTIFDPLAANRLAGEIETLRTFESYWRGAMEGVHFHGLRALAKTPQELWIVRLLASLFLSVARQAGGDLPGAYALYDDDLSQVRSFGRAYQMRRTVSMGFVQWAAGDLPHLAKDATQVLEWGKETAQADSMSYARHFLAMMHYHRNDLLSAEQALSGLLSMRYRMPLICFAESAFILALTYQAQQRAEEARVIAEAVLTHFSELDHADLAPVAAMFQVELALRQGRLDDADLLARRMEHTPLGPMPLFYAPPVTLAKLSLMQRTAESLRSARALLAELHGFLESTHNIPHLIQVLALEALLLQAQGDEAAALDALERALVLAQPGGYIRIFVDLAPELNALLSHLAQRSVAPLLIASIRAANDPVDLEQPCVAPPSIASRVVGSDLGVILTYREQEVLRLLDLRLTNKEIAQVLNISPETVKQHSINIFRKLQVTNRREAAAQARTLGFLAPDGAAR